MNFQEQKATKPLNKRLQKQNRKNYLYLLFQHYPTYTIKDKIYKYYFGYVFFYGIYLLNLSGYLTYLGLNNYTYEIQALSTLIATFLVYFSTALLNTKKLFPKVDKTLKSIAIVMFVLTPFYIIYYSPWNIIVNNLYTVVFCILIISSFYIYIKGKSEIKYYTFAITLYFAFVILFTLMISGKLPYNDITRYGYVYASIVETIFFSFLLANRYNNLKNKVIKVHKTLLKEKNKTKKLLKDEVEKQTKEIKEKNDKLESLLNERELLLKEIYHRVKNNFQVVISMLWFESKKFKDSKQSYLELINRIKSMSIVHQYLYNSKDFSKVQIDVYLIEIVDNLKSIYTKEDIVINLSLEKVNIEFNDAITLGLIINEVITNAVKHHDESEQCIIDLFFKDENDHLVLKIKDNGKGFDYKNVKKGLGLNLINDFCKKLKNGKCEYSFNDGTLFKVSFSKKE